MVIFKRHVAQRRIRIVHDFNACHDLEFSRIAAFVVTILYMLNNNFRFADSDIFLIRYAIIFTFPQRSILPVLAPGHIHVALIRVVRMREPDCFAGKIHFRHLRIVVFLPFHTKQRPYRFLRNLPGVNLELHAESILVIAGIIAVSILYRCNNERRHQAVAARSVLLGCKCIYIKVILCRKRIIPVFTNCQLRLIAHNLELRHNRQTSILISSLVNPRHIQQRVFRLFRADSICKVSLANLKLCRPWVAAALRIVAFHAASVFFHYRKDCRFRFRAALNGSIGIVLVFYSVIFSCHKGLCHPIIVGVSNGRYRCVFTRCVITIVYRYLRPIGRKVSTNPECPGERPAKVSFAIDGNRRRTDFLIILIYHIVFISGKLSRCHFRAI